MCVSQCQLDVISKLSEGALNPFIYGINMFITVWECILDKQFHLNESIWTNLSHTAADNKPVHQLLNTNLMQRILTNIPSSTPPYLPPPALDANPLNRRKQKEGNFSVSLARTLTYHTTTQSWKLGKKLLITQKLIML